MFLVASKSLSVDISLNFLNALVLEAHKENF